jgi:hypothetical protein
MPKQNPQNIKVEIKQGDPQTNSIQIDLVGEPALKFDPQRVKDWVTFRLVCAGMNRCLAKNSTVAEAVNCVSTLAQFRLEEITLAPTAQSKQFQVNVKPLADRLQIQLSGDQIGKSASLFQDSSRIEKQLRALLACKQANHCGTENQSLAERWKCVSTVGAYRFQGRTFSDGA